MYKIRMVRQDTTICFAAEELRKYLGMMDPKCGKIEITFAPDATDGFRLGLLEDFNLPCEAKDVSQDDIVHVEADAEGGIIAGSNPRSVLFAVYRFLKENGCRFLFPGADGEYIPRKPLEQVSYHKMADHRQRAHATEGAPSLEHVLLYIDYQAKQEMNGYGLLGLHPYHNRFYEHKYNEKNRPPEPVDYETVEQWLKLCEAELAKRGTQIWEGGHEFIMKAVGIDPADRFLYKKKKKAVPEEVLPRLAMIDGKRGLRKNDPQYTNFCMSQPDLRRRYAEVVVEELEKNPQVDQFMVWLADTNNNHCECEECRKMRPSDYYVMCLNEMDALMTEKGIKTRIQPISYVDTMFAPEKIKFNNPDRFVLQYAPISRDYTKSITPDSVIPEAKEYVRNHWEMPQSTEEGYGLFKKWQEMYPGDCMVYEYHHYVHQYRDPGMMAFARRFYEDIYSWKQCGMNGCIEDGSNRSFFPNGFIDHIYGATLWNRDLDYEKELEDYFFHCYGPDWKQVRNYLERMSAAFDHAYMCGRRSADPDKGEHYDPSRVPALQSVHELAAEMRALVKDHMAMPTRPQTVCWRLLLWHAKWCEGMADIMTQKCQGHTKYALEMLAKFFDEIGAGEFEYERYFDFGLAAMSMFAIVNKRPKVEF